MLANLHFYALPQNLPLLGARNQVPGAQINLEIFCSNVREFRAVIFSVLEQESDSLHLYFLDPIGALVSNSSIAIRNVL